MLPSGSDGEGEEPALPRSMRQILVSRPVGYVVIGKSLSTIGVFSANVAAAVIVFSITGSARWVSAVTIAQFLPQLFLAPLSGARADRSDRVRILIGGALFLMGGFFVLIAWGTFVGFEAERDAFVIAAAGLIIGIGFAFGGPAIQSLLPSLVRPNELKAVVTLGSLPATLGRTLGPALGAIVATQVGALTAFWVSLVCQFGFVGFVVLAFRGITGPAPSNARRHDVRLRGFFVFVKSQPRLKLLLVGVACIGVAIDPFITLMPNYVDHLGAEPVLVGGLTSAFGVGSVLGVIAMSRLSLRYPSRTLGPAGLLGVSLSLLGLVAVRSTLPAVLIAAFAGLMMTIGITSYSAIMQFLTPDGMRGRLTAMWSLAFLGTRPLAAGLSGVLTDLYEIRAALAVVGAVGMAGALLTKPRRLTPPSPR